MDKPEVATPASQPMEKAIVCPRCNEPYERCTDNEYCGLLGKWPNAVAQHERLNKTLLSQRLLNAAAPDLLKACKAVVEICEDGDTGADFERVVSAMHLASQAISKAEVAAPVSQPICTCQKDGSMRCKFPHPCRRCYVYHPGVSCYWAGQGKTSDDKKGGGKTFTNSSGNPGCAECCNGDRCDDPSHYNRDNCPYCLGSGSVPEVAAPLPEPTDRQLCLLSQLFNRHGSEIPNTGDQFTINKWLESKIAEVRNAER